MGSTTERHYTTPDEVDNAVINLRAKFRTGCTKDLRWRKWQLKQFYWLVEDNEAAIVEALHKDLRRHEFESYAADITSLKADILHHIEHLEQWTADEYPSTNFLFSRLGSTYIRKEPLGLVLIIGAWNFPILLTLQPLVAAIAAGCVAMVKPSEIARASEILICELVPKYLDPDCYTTVTGGPEETQYILTKQYDHIFFTGSASVARYIAKAAAVHLTPTVLELGGQGPAIVTKSANVDLAAKRIAFAKFMNAGQICLSVNHVFVEKEIHDEFVQRASFWFQKFLGDDSDKSHLASIVNERNFNRLQDILQRTGGEVVSGGSFDQEKLRITPTVIDKVDMNDSLLESELFGPLLPVIVADHKEACRIISGMPHPLALYMFSGVKPEIDYGKYTTPGDLVKLMSPVLNNTISGGVTINDCMLHPAPPGVPFGGVGKLNAICRRVVPTNTGHRRIWSRCLSWETRH